MKTVCDLKKIKCKFKKNGAEGEGGLDLFRCLVPPPLGRRQAVVARCWLGVDEIEMIGMEWLK